MHKENISFFPSRSVVDQFTHLHNRSNKLFQERQTGQIWPVTVYEVDKKSLDVRAILILICHDHDVAISQAFKVFFSRILFVVLETYDLNKIVDLGIFKNLQSHTQTHTIKFQISH